MTVYKRNKIYYVEVRWQGYGRIHHTTGTINKAPVCMMAEGTPSRLRAFVTGGLGTCSRMIGNLPVLEE